MSVNKISPYYRNEVVTPLARHEAGHYVIARILGFSAGALSLVMLDHHGGHKGCSEFNPTRALVTIDDIVNYSEDRTQVLYAGALAQSLSNGKIDEAVAIKVLSEGGANDFAKARENIRLIRNIRFSETSDECEMNRELKEISDDLWGKSIDMVENDHLLICGLGSRIASELEYISQEFVLSEEELENLRSIKERFKTGEECTP